MKSISDQGFLDTVLNVTKIYDDIAEYIATSRNCSKMVPVIEFTFLNSTDFKLNERAENVKIEQLTSAKYTKYQIYNINNPNVKISFCVEESDYFEDSYVNIKIVSDE